MRPPTAIERPNITGLITDRLREAIVDGRIRPGSRINEVHLARTLHVSRTPLREALMHIAAEGTVKSIPRRGFFVRPLTVEEFKNLYGVRAILDPEALRLSGVPARERLQRLEALNRKLARAATAARRIELDNRWHLELINGCPNHILIDLIRHFMALTRRYELALLGERSNIQITVSEHKRIMTELRAGKLSSACAALRANMRSGVEPIVRWLKKTEATA